MKKNVVLSIVFFLGSLLFLVLGNLFLTGWEWRYAIGHASHTVLTAVMATIFLLIFRRDRKDLLATGLTYALLALPVFLATHTLSPEGGALTKRLARGATDGNSWALAISMFLMLVAASSVFVRSVWGRRLIRSVATVLWIAAIAVALAHAGYWLTHGAALSGDILFAVYQTNWNEALEYCAVQGFKLPLVLMASAFVLFAVAWRVLVLEQTLAQKHRVIQWGLLVAIVLAATTMVKTQTNVTLSAFDSAQQAAQEISAFKASMENRKQLVTSLSELSKQGNSGLFVIVIGESHARDYMSVYGYERDTTPWLRTRRSDDRFVILENAYSNFANTVPALSQALTAMNQYGDRLLEESPSLVEILEAAGFDTYWVSAQSKFGVFDTPTSLIASQVDQELWLNGMLDEEGRQKIYDGQLLRIFDEIPVVDGRKRAVFLHMNGCHADYRTRYPKESELWRVEDKGRDRLDAYSNAMHYSDEMWGNLLAILERRPDFRAVLMISDHGEDPTTGSHTPDEKLFHWSMVRIPAWFAFSPAYTKAHPERIAAMQDNAWNPNFSAGIRVNLVAGGKLYQ